VKKPVVQLPKLILAGIIMVIALGIAAGIWWAAGNNGASTPAGPTSTPPIPRDLAPDAVIDPPFPSLTYGIHTFLWWNETTRTYDLDMVRLMNFTHVKQRFAWGDIQPEADQWLWDRPDDVVAEVLYRGRSVVARIDGPPEWALIRPADPAAPPVNLDAWATFCGTLAARYRGQIAAYQVWNEPNLSNEWNNLPPHAAGYVALLKTCTERIRAADPDAIIISAGLAPTGGPLPNAVPDVDYLRQMYAAGAAPWFDVLGLNAPGYAEPPEFSPDEAEVKYGNRWMCFRHVEDMRGIMVESGDAAKQVALLEVGWTTDPRPDSPYHWHAVSEEQQAAYLVGAYRYAVAHWRPWVGLMVTIYMADFNWTPDDEQYWWAIDLPGFPPRKQRPAYIDLANMEKVMGDTVIPERHPGAPEAVTVDPLGPREESEGE
jgi:hypothetical protein